MHIEIETCGYANVVSFRDLFRHEAHCQCIRDSWARRGSTDLYLIRSEGQAVGYGAVANSHYPGRLMEFYTLPQTHPDASILFRELIRVSGATEIETQSNIPLQREMLYEFAADITIENFLFHDSLTTHHVCPSGVFRRTTSADADLMFPHHSEPVGDWVVETANGVVATGGFFTHYNPPYADIYMEVDANSRRQGYGGFLVQEIKRVCYEAGYIPAARCDADNIASRRTLQKAGFAVCGRILVGKVAVAG